MKDAILSLIRDSLIQEELIEEMKSAHTKYRTRKSFDEHMLKYEEETSYFIMNVEEDKLIDSLKSRIKLAPVLEYITPSKIDKRLETFNETLKKVDLHKQLKMSELDGYHKGQVDMLNSIIEFEKNLKKEGK